MSRENAFRYLYNPEIRIALRNKPTNMDFNTYLDMVRLDVQGAVSNVAEAGWAWSLDDEIDDEMKAALKKDIYQVMEVLIVVKEMWQERNEDAD